MKNLFFEFSILLVVSAGNGFASSMIFSNLSPAFFACGCIPQGDAIGTPDRWDPVMIGDPFNVPSSAGYTFDSVSLALSFYNGVQSPLTVSLYTSIDDAPNTLLETMLIDTPLPSSGIDAPPVTVNSHTHPVLEAGRTYWIVAAAVNDTAEYVWSDNGLGETGPIYVHDFYYAGPVFACCTHYDILDAFAVMGTAVSTPATSTPEPWSLWFVGLGITLMGIAHLDRIRRCSRIRLSERI